MGRLTYTVIASLDGYINDRDGNYDWAVPGEDLIKFFNDQSLNVSTYLYGRRMYEEMKGWETDPAAAAQSPESSRFAAIWQAADKVVFSSTLESVATSRTRIERRFETALVRQLKQDAVGDLTVDGPTLASHALKLGVVDEIHRFVVPVAVGGGTAGLPEGLHLDLELVEQQRFDKDIAFLRYKVR